MQAKLRVREGDFLLTTAPVSYDYASVRDAGKCEATYAGKPLRWIEVLDASRFGYQEGRYASGLHVVVTPGDRDIDWGEDVRAEVGASLRDAEVDER